MLDLWLHRQLNARVDFEIMNSYSGYPQLIKDQRHETSFLGDDMLREAGIGEEVECPGNTALTGPSVGDTRTPGVPDLAADYLNFVTFLASNHMGFQHHASSKAAQDSELSFWQKANTIYPIKDLRWTIAHPGDDGVSPTPDTLSVAKSEHVDSFEAGVKSEFWNRRARLALTFFAYDAKDQQLTAVLFLLVVLAVLTATV